MSLITKALPIEGESRATIDAPSSCHDPLCGLKTGDRDALHAKIWL